MSLRRTVLEIDPATLNVAEFCRAHGISTWFFWDLRRRAVRGEDVLEPGSRAPRVVANRTSADVEDEIVALRKELGGAGLHDGPATIWFHLARRLGEADAPSEATIWRVLKRRGFIVDDPSKAPKHSHRRFEADRANECWQIDDTFWELADGTEVKIINVVDDRTRLLVASLAVLTCTADAAFAAFAAGAARWGWPARFLSDNAKAFRHGLTTALAALGIRAGHSRPYHPQTCGKVERFHQTLKKFLAAQDRPVDLAELQAQLDAFAELYNHHRPHRAIGRRYPAHEWHDTPKDGPADHPLDAATTIHHVTVSRNGTTSAGRTTISLGTRYSGQAVTIVVTRRRAHVFHHAQLIRALTIDPTKRLQRLYDRPGRPRLS